jgi:hypothetical protein
MINPKIKEYLFYLCSSLLVISAGCYIFEWRFIPYVYALSGAGVAIYFLTNTYDGDNRRLRRLNFQQIIAAILLPLSSYFMFKDFLSISKNGNEWIICLLVSAFLLIYVTFVRENEEKKKN